MNPTAMAEKSMFPTCGSNPSGGEPDAVKVARPVRWGGWRRPAGAVRPLAAPSPPNSDFGGQVKTAFATSPNGKEFITGSSERWGQAAVAAGTDPADAEAAARRTTAFYTGESAEPT